MTENDFAWVTKRLNCTVEEAICKVAGGRRI